MSSVKSWPRKRFLVLVLGGLIGLVGGCGSGGSKLVPVSGKVTVNGQPLTSGWVNFRPDKAKGNTFGGEPIGEVTNGEYTIQTKGKPGAPLGAYKVLVSAGVAVTPDNTNPKASSGVNPTYSNPDTSPLEVTVVEKASPGTYDLKLGP